MRYVAIFRHSMKKDLFEVLTINTTFSVTLMTFLPSLSLFFSGICGIFVLFKAILSHTYILYDLEAQ